MVTVMIQVIESTGKPPGWATIVIDGSVVGPEEVGAVQIVRDRNGPSYLGSNGWQTEKSWITVLASNDTNGQTIVELGPEITFHVLANSNVAVRISMDGASVIDETPLIWPAIQQQASASRRGRRISVAGHHKPEPEQVPVDASTVVPQSDETSPPPASPPEAPAEPIASGSGAAWKIVVGVVVLLAAIAVVLYFFWDKLPFGGRADETPKPQVVLSLDDVRGRLATGLSARDSLAEADRQMDAGNKDAALLLYKRASQGGLAGGHVGMARMYDPDLYSATTSPFSKPNPARAMDLYEKAAIDRDVFAMRRLGILLYESADGDSTVQDAGRGWLKKAAAAGDEEAKAYLAKI